SYPCAALSIIDMRDALLRGLVVLGVCVAVLTEALGALHWLRRTPLAIAWLLILIAAIWLIATRHHTIRPNFHSLRPFDWLIAAGVAAVSIITLIIALVGAPNSADAMSYHMPRVLYWAQSASVSFFPT